MENIRLIKGRVMKKNVLIGFIAGIFIALITASNSYAASSYSLTFSETYTEKLKCYSKDKYCDIISSGKFTISSSISMKEIDIAQFNDQTPFIISVEGFYFESTLGDGGFQPPYNKTKANYPVSGVDIDGKNRKYMTVALSWNKTRMTVKITCITSPWDIEWPVIAGNFLGEPSGKISGEPLYALINIDDFAVEFPLTANLIVKTKTTNKYGDEYDTSNISVKASGPGSVLE